MAAGTVISGGFPGRIAQEVQPNPKCNGCLHFDGQGGRTGICTIGDKPWNCGDGDHADTGYAPIARGAGKYLPDMSTHGAHAPEADTQEVSDLHGAGSTRPVQFMQVSLGEEHVHFAKSMIVQHTALQKSQCRLCKSQGTIGMAPANTGPQICTCEPIEARTVAKSLARQLSNLQGELIDLDQLTDFVYTAAKSNFDPSIAKANFFHAHGKYEVSPAGGGKHHVDFHPKGGGKSTRVGTADSPGDARRMTNVHAKRFASGTGTEHGGAPMPDPEKTGKHKKVSTSAWTMPHLMAKKSEGDDEVDKSDTRNVPKGPLSEAAIHATAQAQAAGTRGAHTKARNAHVKAANARETEGYAKKFHEIHAQYHSQVLHSGDVKGGHTEKSEDENDVEKADEPRHPHDLKAGDLIVHSGGNAGFHNPESPYRHGQLAQVHKVSKNPHTGETVVHVKHHLSNGKMSPTHSLTRYDSSRHPTAEDMQAHSKTLKRHFNAKAKIKNAQAAQAPAMPATTEKSFGEEIDDTVLTAETMDDMEKSLRWSHKTPGQASTSHGKYHVTANADGGHTVTYTHKESGKSYAKTFASHREALGAVTEHHLKNRPPPKPRKKKDPNAPKKPKGAGAAPAGGCPPCP